jgi:hypothetical protein
VSAHAEVVKFTVAHEDWGNALLAVIEIMLLALPILGLIFFFAVLVRAVVRLALHLRAAATSAPSQRPGIAPADGAGSFQAAIAEHLELKRRHAEEVPVSRRPSGAGSRSAR